MVLFKSSEDNQSKVNAELLLKQCQNNVAVMSGATMMLTSHLTLTLAYFILFQETTRWVLYLCVVIVEVFLFGSFWSIRMLFYFS